MEKQIDVTDHLNHFHLHTLPFIVKVTAEIKKNRFMQNVGPDSYESTLKNKAAEPKWR